MEPPSSPSDESAPASGQKPQSRRRKYVRRLVKVLAIGLLCFVSLEVATRAFFALQLGPRALVYGTPWFRQEISVAKKKAQNWKSDVVDPTVEAGPAHENVVLEYSKYFPNERKQDVDPNGVSFELQINNNGFRGADYSQEKKPGVLRVVTLGASSTFGYGSRDDETYPIYLEQALNEECETEYEVINLGIPHLTSASILSLFEAEALPLDPDVVTFYEGINDSSASTSTFSVEGMKHVVRHSWVSAIYDPLIGIYRATRDRSMLVLLVDNMIQSSDQSTREDVDRYLVDGRSENFLSNLEKIRAECEKRDIVFIPASQQLKSFLIPRDEIRGVSYEEEWRLVNQALDDKGSVNINELYFLAHRELMLDYKKWAVEKQLPLVDMIERLDGRRDVLYSYVHLTPEGNRLVAQEFAAAILKLTCF